MPLTNHNPVRQQGGAEVTTASRRRVAKAEVQTLRVIREPPVNRASPALRETAVASAPLWRALRLSGFLHHQHFDGFSARYEFEPELVVQRLFHPCKIRLLWIGFVPFKCKIVFICESCLVNNRNLKPSFQKAGQDIYRLFIKRIIPRVWFQCETIWHMVASHNISCACAAWFKN